MFTLPQPTGDDSVDEELGPPAMKRVTQMEIDESLPTADDEWPGLSQALIESATMAARESMNNLISHLQQEYEWKIHWIEKNNLYKDADEKEEALQQLDLDHKIRVRELELKHLNKENIGLNE